MATVYFLFTSLKASQIMGIVLPKLKLMPQIKESERTIVGATKAINMN